MPSATVEGPCSVRSRLEGSGCRIREGFTGDGAQLLPSIASSRRSKAPSMSGSNLALWPRYRDALRFVPPQADDGRNGGASERGARVAKAMTICSSRCRAPTLRLEALVAVETPRYSMYQDNSSYSS